MPPAIVTANINWLPHSWRNRERLTVLAFRDYSEVFDWSLARTNLLRRERVRLAEPPRLYRVVEKDLVFIGRICNRSRMAVCAVTHAQYKQGGTENETVQRKIQLRDDLESERRKALKDRLLTLYRMRLHDGSTDDSRTKYRKSCLTGEVP